jgi:hypothetical protein
MQCAVDSRRESIPSTSTCPPHNQYIQNAIYTTLKSNKKQIHTSISVIYFKNNVSTVIMIHFKFHSQSLILILLLPHTIKGRILYILIISTDKVRNECRKKQSILTDPISCGNSLLLAEFKVKYVKMNGIQASSKKSK